MNPATILIYLDTNVLIHARNQIMLSRHRIRADLVDHNKAARADIITALDGCEQLRPEVGIVTTAVAMFEMIDHFRRWNAMELFSRFHVPASIYDGRNREWKQHTRLLRKLEPALYQKKADEIRDWLGKWKYRHVVKSEGRNLDVFNEAQSYLFVDHEVGALDAVHIAAARQIGARFFVTSDNPLANFINENEICLWDVPPGDEDENNPARRLRAWTCGEFKDAISKMRAKKRRHQPLSEAFA